MRILPDPVSLCLEGEDRGRELLCKQSRRSLAVEERFSLGVRLAGRNFFAPQAIEHDLNTPLARRRAAGAYELSNNHFVQFSQQLIESPPGFKCFLGGKLGNLEGGIPSFWSLGNHLMDRSLRNLLTYENKLVLPTTLFHSRHEH